MKISSRRFTHALKGSLKLDIIEKDYSCIQGEPEIMEIIRERPSALRSLVLDGKNYSYWKPHMIFFIKTLDERAWRALMAGYEPPMITVDGESISDYNERVLELANEALLLGEKIPDYKIVRKVLRSLPRKFDMKVIAIEEAHNITTLKVDELFGSLLNFEMAISDIENKKGNGISFKSIYEEETIVNQSDNEANMNESIALLTK
ncbi:gag-pol polyprotein [Cucumis melo var. makuwa]|uniref:Gag-pol polyprotein n=1 Tax=Cucumis melo var. makuwa TaxID=1194695 RepID=A0A5A7T683_CUCMM|nr:gag-pol polyprotein [Cucumis melo var. makuwa]TYJ96682.1 gag-pol polyprotein [Cucumis melo var. makuwa]